MEIVVSGREFTIEKEEFVEDGEIPKKTVRFYTYLEGRKIGLKATYTAGLIKSLREEHGLDAEEELEFILTRELKSELFLTVNDLTLEDLKDPEKVTPEIIQEYVDLVGEIR